MISQVIKKTMLIVRKLITLDRNSGSDLQLAAIFIKFSKTLKKIVQFNTVRVTFNEKPSVLKSWYSKARLQSSQPPFITDGEWDLFTGGGWDLVVVDGVCLADVQK